MLALANNKYENLGAGGMLGYSNRSARAANIIYKVFVEPWCMGHGRFNKVYHICKYLGGGAFGKVFSATNKRTGDMVSGI